MKTAGSIDSESAIARVRASMGLMLRGVVTEAYSHKTTGEQFTVKHGLGMKPKTVSWLPYTDLRVWSDESDRKIWDERTVTLRCNIAEAKITFLIIG
jgi:hypothetical protein